MQKSVEQPNWAEFGAREHGGVSLSEDCLFETSVVLDHFFVVFGGFCG